MSDLSKVCSRLGDRAAGRVMQAQLGDLDACFLELQCCKRTVILPVRLLLSRQPGKRVQRLADVLPLLNCKDCKGPPAAVWLNETQNRTDCYGAPPGWSVQLIPLPVIEATG